MTIEVKKGLFDNLGIRKLHSGIGFTFQCAKESTVSIRLFSKKTGEITDIAIPDRYCIGEVYSVTLSGIDFEKYEYNMVVDGEEQLFPYATSVIGRQKWGDLSRLGNGVLRGAFDFPEFDWEQDTNPEHPSNELMLYKLHVRGFTKSDRSIPASRRGTFAALEEKLPYLKSLSINAVELMPIYEFEELCTDGELYKDWNPLAVKGHEMLAQETPVRINYWGYGTGNYYAPKRSYAHSGDPITELKHLIRALHANGIECIMEMSFPTDTSLPYIVNVLKFWVRQYHIDGFHLLVPGIDARILADEPLLKRTRIFYDNIFSDNSSVRGYRNLYQYRDDFSYVMRKQLNAIENNMIETLRYLRLQSTDICYVNYIANNNGFTLHDLFSYTVKRNEANGEHNMDGNDYNYSQNCGAEGATRKKHIKRARETMMKLALTVTAVSQGCPLIFMGDEFGNSQDGNNNAYCQDNKLGYLSWDDQKKHPEVLAYAKELFAFRRSHPVLSRPCPIDFNATTKAGIPPLSYHGRDAWIGGISPIIQTIGILFSDDAASPKKNLYLALNFSSSVAELALPSFGSRKKLKFVFGTCAFEGDVRSNILDIPPHTAWFFED